MRVAVLTQYFPNSRQPWAGHSAYQTLRVLAGMCELRVFYPEATYPALLRPKTHVGALDRAWQPKDVAVEYIPYGTLPVVGRPLNGFAMARALLPAVRAFAPEVVLNYVAYPDGYAAVRIGEELGVPVALTAIGSDLNRISGRLTRVLTRRALRRADAVMTVSRDLAKTAVRLGAEAARTRAILNGCDTGVFHPRDRVAARLSLGVPVEGEIALYVGRLDVRKGLLELVEAAASMRGAVPGLRVYLVGDGPDRPLVEEAVSRHGLAETVTLVPSRPTEQVALWMGAADLVTLPSYAEGCPNVVIEALASGRPVVATRVGGIPELMDENSGHLVPPKDVAALATALDAALATEWDGAAIASRHNRSWAAVAKDVYEVLEAVTAGRPAGL